MLVVLMMALTSFPALANNTVAELTDANLPANALYNGIVYPADYQFSIDPNKGDAVTAPYLLAQSKGGYAPGLINIDRGRQLFVDDFLIDSTSLSRTYYQAYENPDNPVFYPEAKWELTDFPSTACTSGGIWYDMEEKVYKMWYEAGFNNVLAYATSTDGIHWERPAINSDGTNTLVRQQRTDSFSIWIDYNAAPNERYKLMIRSPNDSSANKYDIPAVLYTSANGLNWSKRAETGPMGDRSTFFYNPFSEQWVFSIRGQASVKWGNTTHRPRLRYYHAGESFLTAGKWEKNEPILWLRPDSADKIDLTASDEIPELYNFDSVAYESVMLGFHQMWYGPENDVIAQTKNPKITEIQVGFSRDGFHYDRPMRSALISASRTEGTWDYGYLQSATGGVIVYENEIRIYYSGFSGDYKDANGYPLQGAYLGGAVGYASLRRDGFASMDGTGVLLTKPLTVTKDVKYLFVNANSSAGSLRAEILDKDGRVLEGYSREDCTPIVDNSCRTYFTWSDGKTLEQLKGKAFRIRFVMEKGTLYSFWLAPDEAGSSNGEMAAGYVSSETEDSGTPSEPTVTTPATDETSGGKKKGCGSAAGALAVMLSAAAGCALLSKKRRGGRR